MNTLEAIRAMLELMPEEDQIKVHDYTKQLYDKFKALDSLYGSLPNDITEEEAREERLDALDPFYDPANIARIEKSVQELHEGKGTSHDLIED